MSLETVEFEALRYGHGAGGTAMQSGEPLDILPLWALLAVVLLVVLLSVECGYRLGKAVGDPEREKDTPLNEMVGADRKSVV